MSYIVYLSEGLKIGLKIYKKNIIWSFTFSSLILTTQSNNFDSFFE